MNYMLNVVFVACVEHRYLGNVVPQVVLSIFFTSNVLMLLLSCPGLMTGFFVFPYLGFSVFPLTCDIFLKAVFLLTLASSCRVRELQALSLYYLCSCWVVATFSFLTKNELAGFQRGPLVIDAWLVRPGVYHLLYPVVALHHYLCTISSAIVYTLFVDPVSLVSVPRLAFLWSSVVS